MTVGVLVRPAAIQSRLLRPMASRRSTIATAYTKLLLHMNGADASTTFTDEAGHTMTAVGNAQIDTAQSKFGGASGLFDGTGDRVTTPDSDDWHFGSGDFTIDFWIRTAADAADYDIVSTRTAGVVESFLVYKTSGQNIAFLCSDDGVGWDVNIATSVASVTAGNWRHVACVRNGTDFRIYIDGTQSGTTATFAGSLLNSTNALQICGAGLGDFTGHLDEVRISKGIARWTSNFTPPTGEYTLD
jgi:hypothetical protein